MVKTYGMKILPEQTFLKIKNNLFKLLPADVADSMCRYKIVNVLQRSLLGEMMSRIILAGMTDRKPSEITFLKSEKGKPYLEGNPVYFNISHSKKWVVAAVCNDFDVGIDVEKIKSVNFEIAERFFSEKEKKMLLSKTGDEKTEYFFNLWTLKESYLKLLGKGLTKPLNTFTVSGDNGLFHLSNDIDNIKEVYFRQFNLDDKYKLSLCSYCDGFEDKITVLDVDALLHF